jgi:hypothetical protein
MNPSTSTEETVPELVWIVTDTELEATFTEGSRDGTRDLGGGYGPRREVTVTEQRRVAVRSDRLRQEMNGLLNVVQYVFNQAQRQSDLELSEVELAVEISGEGQVSILGSGGKMTGKGGMILKFKRRG